MSVTLADKLEQLGLSQYLEILVSEGFDTWDTVLDIQESDLNSLGFKLGHRRKLQRAIADSRAQNQPDLNLRYLHRKAPSVEGSLRSDDSGAENKTLKRSERTTGPSGPSTKRRYRRHPKPDENAPERPASAYVIFSNQMREELKPQELSFTEIAKVVGERWQVLQPEVREAYERQAQTAKEKYYAELAEYKKTPQYSQYQEYLADFKAKHNPPAENKPPPPSKLETETSVSTQSSGGYDLDRLSRNPSTGYSESVTTGPTRSPSSPPTGPHSGTSGHGQPSKPMPSATLFGNTSRPAERYSPLSLSPVSGPLSNESSHDISRRGHERRSSSSLPALSREGTTISSEGGYTQRPPPSWPVPLHSGPQMGAQPDIPKHVHRVLPQPVPTAPVAPSPLDRPRTQTPPAQSPPAIGDARYSSSLAALLRAGELARDADNQDSSGGKGTSS